MNAVWPKWPKKIETISDRVAEILRGQTAAERAARMSQMHEDARTMVRSILTSQHPDWTEEQIHSELLWRLFGRRPHVTD